MASLIQLDCLHKPEPGAHTGGTQASIALTMVKNEGDIIGAWISHACALFDVLFLVDHSSTDGTREFLLDFARTHANVYLYEFEEQGYFQEEITNQLAELAAREYPGAWLFPLDADEFLAVSSRDELLRRLAVEPTDQLLNAQWRNVAPLSLCLDEPLALVSPCLLPPYRGAYGKIILHASQLLGRGLHFMQGNHGVRDMSGTYTSGDTALDFGEIYHVPIRSLEHFVLKCVQGCLAYESLPSDRKDPSQGFHWRRMVGSVLKDGRLDAVAVRQFIAHYGQPSPAAETPAQMGIYDLITAGWTCTHLDVAHVEPLVVARRRSYADLVAEMLGTQADPDLAAFADVAARGTMLQRDEHLRGLAHRTLPATRDR